MTARKAAKRAPAAKSVAKSEPQRPEVAAKRAPKPPSAPQRRTKSRPPASPETPELTPPKAPRPARPTPSEAVTQVAATAVTAATAQSVATMPEAAFDTLYTHSVRGLVRQVELLTGNPGLAWHAVRRAFDLAWQRWPEVATDPDPVGWVRATAYAYALAPWQQWVPGHRTRRPAAARASSPGAEQDRALRSAVLRLPRAQRQAVVLYDGLGLDLPVAAAESEASTVAMAGRITKARDALSAALPELGEQAAARLHVILAEPEPEPEPAPDTGPAAEPGPDAGPAAKPDPDGGPAAEPAAPWELPAARMRDTSERNVHRRTLAAVALTAVIAGATGAALVVTYDRVGDLPHYAQPTQRTAPSSAVPRRGGPEPAFSGHPVPRAPRQP